MYRLLASMDLYLMFYSYWRKVGKTVKGNIKYF